MSKYTVNQDIRDYMADHSVTQTMLAEQMGVKLWKVNTILKSELSQKEKEDILRHIDAIVADRNEEVDPVEEPTADQTEDVSTGPKFQVGDLVKIPAKANTIGTVCDIWHSMVQSKLMYAVDIDGGHRGLYSEEQLEPAPIPIEYTFSATVENNVAVVVMNATQGEKTWVYARGHAHILHDGEVGMAQAVSFAARRMFEALDSKQDNKIYLKEYRRGME